MTTTRAQDVRDAVALAYTHLLSLSELPLKNHGLVPAERNTAWMLTARALVHELIKLYITELDGPEIDTDWQELCDATATAKAWRRYRYGN